MKLYVLLMFSSLLSLNINGKTRIFHDKFNGNNIICELYQGKNINVDNIIFFKYQGKIFKRKYKYLTPEMFGAKGDGRTDDFYAIQQMLDKGEEGCTFYFDGKKTYYNSFANNGKWTEPMKRNIWQRFKSATFLFNGAKLRRRLPEWNDKNMKNDYNEGEFYTDDHTALLYLNGTDFKIDGADFNSGIPLGNLLNTSEKPTNITDYAIGTCMEMGLWLDKCSNVMITNSKFTNSVFPIYITEGNNITFKNLVLKYAAQASKRINPKDQALGGGIKLIKCNNIILENVYGYRNLNDTIEIESLNTNVTVTGSSDYDYANSMVIISSQNIKLEWKANNIVSGTGVLIIGTKQKSYNLETKNIQGSININKASWCGVLIWLAKETISDISNIKLNITTQGTGYTGLYVNNESDKYSIKGLDLFHESTNDGTATGISRWFNNRIEGICTGKSSNAITGVKITGKQAVNPISIKINSFKNVTKKFDID